jgi:hypothetical protein
MDCPLQVFQHLDTLAMIRYFETEHQCLSALKSSWTAITFPDSKEYYGPIP